MEVNLREQIQERASSSIIDNEFKGIYYLAPRTGKSKIVLDSFKELGDNTKILITAPFNSIIDSWNKEIIKWNHNLARIPITLINQRSLDKIDVGDYNIICCDEIHTLSDLQIEILQSLRQQSKLFGITGSLSDSTRSDLYHWLGLKVNYIYPLNQAIEDKIISDYKIKVYLCQLDDTIKNVPAGSKAKPFLTTEKKSYDWLTSEFNRFKSQALNPMTRSNRDEKMKMFFAGKRARLLYSCNSKIALAKKLIDQQDRTLIFTTLIESAKKLTEYSYTSKSKGDELDLFINEKINKLAVINMSSMGITIPNLKHSVCHQLQSSEELAIQKILRAMNFDLGKDAEINIIVAENTVDMDWCSKALNGFDSSKIKYYRLL